MRSQPIELAGLSVTVDRVVYAPDLPAPEDRPHSFVYFITIHNDSELTVVIKARKWVVRNSRGEVDVVEGDGVVGEFPRLSPGKSFSYNSRHIMASEHGVATGSYFGVDETGRVVFVRIPEFVMRVP